MFVWKSPINAPFCAAVLFLPESPEFCSVNVTPSALVSLTHDDYLMISCQFSYLAADHWTPHVECLPYVRGQTTETTNNETGSVVYTKLFQATPELHGKVLKCNGGFARENDASDDIQLWISTSLQIHCKNLLLIRRIPWRSVIIWVLRGGLGLQVWISHCPQSEYLEFTFVKT